MPSYLEKEQLLQVPPSMANASSILNTFNTKVQYWGAGAARIKSAYDRYLGMDLSREDNQGKLKEFMKGANEQMKKTVQTDLSVGDNQVQALGIFDPLVNGETDFSKNILGDNAITSHYKSQFATAESYRTRDGGKEYSDTNVAYLSQHLEDFKNEKDPGAWKNYYGQRRSYTPYYDYTKEVRELMDSYKPNQMSKTSTTSSLYFHTVEDKSTTADDALRYINANLSQKARNQMGIEGSVTFHGRDEDLLKSVRADWDSDISKYDSYSKSLEAEIRVAKDPAQKAQLEGEKTLVLKRIANIKSNVDDFNKGDYSEIMKNKESYANKLYSNNLLESIASGYARTDYTEKYSPDQAAISQMNETGRNLRLVSQQNFDKGENQLDRDSAERIAAMRAEAAAKDSPGSGTFGIPKAGDSQTSINLSEEDRKKSNLSIGTLQGDLDTQNTTQQAIYGVIHDRLVSAGKIKKVDDPETRTRVVQAYLKDVDATYNDYMSKVHDPAIVRGLMEREYYPGIMESIDGLRETNQTIYAINAVKNKITQDSMGEVKGLYNSGELTVAYAKNDGKTQHLVITPKVAMDFVVNGDRSVIQQKDIWEGSDPATQPGQDMFTAEGVMPSGHSVTAYFYKGRQLNTSQVEALHKSINSAIDKKYSSDLVENKNIWQFGPNSKVRLDVAKKEILANVTHKDKELKEGDFQVVGYSEDGNIYFKGDGNIVGAKQGKKDFDNRYIYELPSSTFKVETAAAIPANARGLKYFLDKQTPFLKPGETISTPSDKNFFQVGDVRYRVEAERNVDGSVSYNLYDLDNGKFITREYDFYSLAQYANTYPQVKSQIK